MQGLEVTQDRQARFRSAAPLFQPPTRDEAVAEPRWQTTTFALWMAFAASAGVLLMGGRRDYPTLHTALDTAIALLPPILAWLLWDIGRGLDRRLPHLLAITFALAAVVNVIHLVFAVKWSGPLAFITLHAGDWRPVTWPPATHLLPIGVLYAVLHAGEPRRREVAFVVSMVVGGVTISALFGRLPKYTLPGILGHTRPFLAVVPLLWAGIAALAFTRLTRDRLLAPIMQMAIVLAVASFALLYSAGPYDTESMIAHLGRVCAYLAVLFALLRLATIDMQARARAEEILSRANTLLEAHVQERTAELAQANQFLQESEARFRAFLGATADVIYRMGADWTEMRQLVGQEFIPDTLDPSCRWLEKYIPPVDQARVVDAIGEAIRTKTVFQLEHRVIRVDGTLGWTFSRAVPLFNDGGDIIEWFGAASDVTVRKEAELAAQAQLTRLSLLGQITRAIGERQDPRSIYQVALRSLEDQLSVDLACLCLYRSSDQTLTVVGIGAKSLEVAAGLAMPESAHIAIDENGLSQCVRGQLVHEPDITASAFPFPQRLAQGGLRAFVAAPLQVESQLFGVLLVARKAANSFSSAECDFLRQLSDHVGLASHQARLYESLQRAYEDLRKTQEAVMQQERLRTLGQMASGIAHDINNALSPAALYAQALLERDQSLSDRAREYLTVIQQAIEGVGHTVERMRMFYRPREPELTLSPVDLNSLLQQVVELTHARWNAIPQERGIVIDLKKELAVELPAIMGAENEIRDALTNLVINAVDAMPRGGVLTVRSKVSSIHRDGKDDPLVCIEIGDTGVGMTDEVRDRCLEPFYTTKGERGTGLGLAMVYGMGQRHSADLEIESAVGVGTTVRLTFTAAAPAEAHREAYRAHTTAPLHILLVDDDPLLLKSLRDILQSEGHRVTAVDGGRKGIDAFFTARQRGDSFEVVITDLGMPTVDGRTVAAAIKPAAPETAVIMLTGWGQRLQDEQELPENVDRVLSKPPRLSEVRAALGELSRSAASRAHAG